MVIIGEIYAQLAYNNFSYELMPEGLRINRGIIMKKYSSIPFERIQNIDLKRGIVARIIGFTTVEIHTAGYSGVVYSRGRSQVPRAEGYLPALSVIKAEELRTYLMKKIKGEAI